MRFLLIFLVVLVVAWRWRVWRNSQIREETPPPKDSLSAMDMVSCQECGLHVAQAEAIVGRSGSYCSDAHRRLREN